MKIQINITKWNFILIIGIVLIAVGGMVYGYNAAFNKTPADPPVFGHSADEVNIKIIGSERTLQEVMNNISGKTLCELNYTELSKKGCPSGTILYKINKTTGLAAPHDAYCKIFYSTNDNSADLSTNPIKSCYDLEDRGFVSPGPSYIDPCDKVCDPSNDNIGLFCCIGGRTVACEKTRSGTYSWIDKYLAMCQ